MKVHKVQILVLEYSVVLLTQSRLVSFPSTNKMLKCLQAITVPCYRRVSTRFTLHKSIPAQQSHSHSRSAFSRQLHPTAPDYHFSYCFLQLLHKRVRRNLASSLWGGGFGVSWLFQCCTPQQPQVLYKTRRIHLIDRPFPTIVFDRKALRSAGIGPPPVPSLCLPL